MNRACWLRHQIGFRGAFLLSVGGFDICYGWTKMISPASAKASQQQMALLAEVFPLGHERTSIITWGMLWWITAAFCIVNAFRQEDRWGFGMAIGVKIGWLLGNTYAWANGLPGAGSTVAVWTWVLVIVVLISMWAEPSVGLESMINDMHDADQADQAADRAEWNDRADRAEEADRIGREEREANAQQADADRGLNDGA